MQQAWLDATIGYIAITTLAGGSIALVIMARHRRLRAERANAERSLSAILDSQLADDEQQRVLSDARERARLLYPDLMDADEVDRSQEPPIPIPIDEDLMQEARAALITAPQEATQDIGKSELEKLRKFLQKSDYWRDREPRVEKTSRYLTQPARIIDCGAAGKVLLYSIEHVNAARQASGYASYLKDRDEVAFAHATAATLLRNMREHSERLVLQRREEEAAITIRVEDLPLRSKPAGKSD